MCSSITGKVMIDKLLMSKYYGILCALMCLFTSIQFIIPLFLEPASLTNVYHQQVCANDLRGSLIVQHAGALIYAFGDLTCHQMAGHSFFLNGNQMPVCSRCIGIYMGMCLIGAVAVYRVPLGGFVEALLSLLFPKGIERYGNRWILLFSACLLLTCPLTIDGLVQYFTTYESWNGLRVATGFLFGIAEGAVIIAIVSAFYSQCETW
jgi:uncharacterized membrane protein